MAVLEYYTEEELKALYEKWYQEEERLKNLDDYWYIAGKGVTKETEGIVNARLNYERRQFRERLKYVTYPETDSKIELEGITYAVYADCMMIKVPHMPMKVEIGGKRGKCTGFSRAARLRMKKRLAKLNLKGKYSFFVTLTYPKEYVKDMRVSKRDLDVFRKAFAREFNTFVGGIWRVERQKRGAPHYHMLLISDEPVSKTKIIEFVRRRWPEIVRTSYLSAGGDKEAYQVHYERHQRSGHNVQFMETREMVQNYISKYIAKEDETEYPDSLGRCWGQWQFNGKKLDYTAAETGTLARDEMVMLKRIVRKHKEASNRLSLEEERYLKSNDVKNARTQKELQRKLRRHKSDKRYAKRIGKQNTITLFGYGVESKNNGVIGKMLDASRLLYAISLVEKDGEKVRGRQPDLINMHISPQDGSSKEAVVFNGSLSVVETAVLGRDGPSGVVATVKGIGVSEDVGRSLVSKKSVFSEEEWRKGEELQLRRVREYRERYDLSDIRYDNVGISQKEKS